jgi:hypothetical protein
MPDGMPLTEDTPTMNEFVSIEQTSRRTCSFIRSSTRSLEVTAKDIQLGFLAVLILSDLVTRGLGILHLSGRVLDLLVGCNQVRFLRRCKRQVAWIEGEAQLTLDSTVFSAFFTFFSSRTTAVRALA